MNLNINDFKEMMKIEEVLEFKVERKWILSIWIEIQVRYDIQWQADQ